MPTIDRCKKRHVISNYPPMILIDKIYAHQICTHPARLGDPMISSVSGMNNGSTFPYRPPLLPIDKHHTGKIGSRPTVLYFPTFL
jgi:hypothetical protein